MAGTSCNIRDYRRRRNSRIITEYNRIAKRNPELYQCDIIKILRKRLRLDIKERQVRRVLSLETA